MDIETFNFFDLETFRAKFFFCFTMDTKLENGQIHEKIKKKTSVKMYIKIGAKKMAKIQKQDLIQKR